MVYTGLSLPFLGTVLGSAMVFFMRASMNRKVEKFLLGIAAGVMVAASVWSLLIPSIEMAEEQGSLAWIPALSGFLLGILFLLVLDSLIPHLHLDDPRSEGLRTHLGKSSMLVLAVTLHNIPEGMAVGVSFASVLIGDGSVTAAGAFALAIGIAIQNFPEGAIVSMPVCNAGIPRGRAFFCGVLSGLVEPVGSVLTIFLTGLVIPFLPYFLAFAAGAMIYVVVEELIPEAQSGADTDIATIGVALGFSLMMVLDVAFG